MRVELAVRTQLLADATVSALVGTRGYTQRFPQSPTLPAFRVQLIDEQEPAHLRGGSDTRPARVQVDAIAAEGSGTDAYAQATSLADAISAALMSKAPFVVDSLEVKVVERQSRAPMYDPDELRLVIAGQDFLMWSREL
jgi:hypothetical protein